LKADILPRIFSVSQVQGGSGPTVVSRQQPSNCERGKWTCDVESDSFAGVGVKPGGSVGKG